MSDIVTLNGYKIKDEKAVRSYDTVASMKADTKLKEGYHVKTKGYYEANDGGNGEYIIIDDDTLVSDNGSIHALSNGLRAKLIIDDTINIKQFGAKCDGETDDTTSIQTAITLLDSKIKTLVIPGISVVSDKLQFQLTGTTLKGYNINTCGIKLDGDGAYIEFGGLNTTTHEVQVRDLFIRGDYTQSQLLQFNKCFNIYLNRVYLNQASENNYLIKFINGSGMVWIKECILDSSEDLDNYPSYANGIYFDKMDSLFDMSGCNCWNLQNLLDFRNTTLQVNIHDNWIECCKQLFYHTGATDLRYMNLNIENNTFNLHSQNSFTPGTTNLIKIDGTSTTNAYNSYIKLINNNIYLWDTTLENDTLINIPLVQTDGTIYIVYDGNVLSGKTLQQLESYVCYLNSTLTNTIKFVSVVVNSRLDSKWLTNVNTAIICGMRNETNIMSYCYPNGIYLTKTETLNKGNITYDETTNRFYGGYNGTLRQIPQRVGTAFPYATSSTDMVQYMNDLTTALVQSGIIDRQV